MNMQAALFILVLVDLIAFVVACNEGRKQCGSSWCSSQCIDNYRKNTPSHNKGTYCTIGNNDFGCKNKRQVIAHNEEDDTAISCCKEGERRCASKWYGIECQGCEWKNVKFCKQGSKCGMKNNEFYCTRGKIVRTREDRATFSCNEGEKRCGSDWWGIQCTNGQWKNIKSCQKGDYCALENGNWVCKRRS